MTHIVGHDKPPLENKLLHFGVKGMKWGQRNSVDSSSGGEKLDRQGARQLKRSEKGARKEWKKGAMSTETANAAFQDAVKSFAPAQKAINNDPAFKGKDLTKDRRLARQYDDVVNEVFNQHLAQASVNRTYNADIDRAIVYQFDRNVGMMRATEMKRLRQSAITELGVFPDFKVTMDDLGHILDYDVIEEESDGELMQYALSDNDIDFLEHFGVKGMKWGVKRAASATAGAAKTAWVGKPDASGVTRQDVRKAARRASWKTQDAVEKVDHTYGKVRDNEIYTAREGIRKANEQYKTARKTYKTDKTVKGKNAAKIALKKARYQHLTVHQKSELDTTPELAVKAALKVGKAVMEEMSARKERREAPERARQAENDKWQMPTEAERRRFQ